MSKDRRVYPSSQIRDALGYLISFTASNGDPNEINMTTAVADYESDQDKHPAGFFIKPLTDGVIKVQLFDQSDSEYYIFSAEEVEACYGVEINAKIRKIYKVGTTVTRLKVVW